MKARKIAAIILTLALFALPVQCLGEAASASFLEKAYEAGRGVKATVTFKPGQALEQDPSMAAVCSLLKDLRVEAFRQKQGGAALDRLELSIKSEPALSLALLKNGGEYHIFSSLLHNQALSFTQEELGQLFRFDPQSLQDDLLAPLSVWLDGVVSGADVTTGTFVSGKHDTAVTKVVYTLTADRIGSLLNTAACWANKEENLDRILEYASRLIPKATRESVEKAIQSLPDAAAAMEEPVILTAWLNAKGTLKAAELKAKFAGTVISAGMYVKTLPDGVTSQYSLNIAPEEVKEADDVSTMFGMIAPEADSLTLSLTVTDVPLEKQGDAAVTFSRWHFSGVVKGSGTDLYGIGLSYSGKTISSAKSVQNEWTLDINARPYFGASLVLTEKSTMSGKDAVTDGTLNLYYLPGSEPTCTATYSAASCEPEALPDIPKDSVRLGKMNLKELQAWWQEAYPVIAEELAGVAEKLPD